MATLTYKRCWSREEERDAKNFYLANYERVGDGVGCAPGTPEQIAEAVMLRTNRFLVALDGEVIVAVFLIEDRHEHLPDFIVGGPRWMTLAAAALPNYGYPELLRNMSVAMGKHIFDGEGGGWEAFIAPEHVPVFQAMPWVETIEEASGLYIPAGWYRVSGPNGMENGLFAEEDYYVDVPVT